MQAGFTVAGITALLATALSIWADRRQSRRGNLDAVGIIPWGLVTVVGVLLTLFAFAFALAGAGG